MSPPDFTLQDLLTQTSGEMFLRQAAIQNEESLADFADTELHDGIQIIEENPQ
jgi:hypothetical protein